MIGTRLIELTGAEGMGVAVGVGLMVLVGVMVGSADGGAVTGRAVGSNALAMVLLATMGAVGTIVGVDVDGTKASVTEGMLS